MNQNFFFHFLGGKHDSCLLEWNVIRYIFYQKKKYTGHTVYFSFVLKNDKTIDWLCFAGSDF